MATVRALFPKGKEPRYAFEVLIRTLPEAVFRFNHDGISMRALDPTKSMLYSLTFYATSLEDYVVEEETKVGIIFTTLKDVIKRVGSIEKLELEVDLERNRFILNIYPKRGKEVGLSRRFSFPIMAVMEEEVPELGEEYTATFEIDASTFDDSLSIIEEVSDFVQITASPSGVLLKGIGEGGKAAEISFEQDNELLFSLSVDEPATAKYSVDSLRNITSKMKSLSKRVKVELSEGRPIRLTYEFTTGVFTSVIVPRTD